MNDDAETPSIVASLTAAERRAVALIALMIRLHGGLRGRGLFTGITRYQALQQRVTLAAERSRSVHAFWSRMHRDMLWTITGRQLDDEILPLIAARDDDGAVLRALADEAAVLIMIARYQIRLQRPDEGADAAEDGSADAGDPGAGADGGLDDDIPI